MNFLKYLIKNNTEEMILATATILVLLFLSSLILSEVFGIGWFLYIALGIVVLILLTIVILVTLAFLAWLAERYDEYKAGYKNDK